jgi:hypothetical protein
MILLPTDGANVPFHLRVCGVWELTERGKAPAASFSAQRIVDVSEILSDR